MPKQLAHSYSRFPIALLLWCLFVSNSKSNTVVPVETEDELHSQIQNHQGCLFILLYDRDCFHCQSFFPRYEQIAEELEKKYGSSKFLLVDLHTKPRIVDEYMKLGLMTFPFLAYYEKGKFHSKYDFNHGDDESLEWIRDKVKHYSSAHKEMAQKSTSDVVFAKAKPTTELTVNNVASFQQKPEQALRVKPAASVPILF